MKGAPIFGGWTGKGARCHPLRLARPSLRPPTPFFAAVTTQNFDQQEALLARDLAALISDGQYLKHYGGWPRVGLLCGSAVGRGGALFHA